MVIGIGRIDLHGPFEVDLRRVEVASLEMNQPELMLSIGVLRIQREILETPLEFPLACPLRKNPLKR